MDTSIPALIQAQARVRPDALAVADDVERLTFSELADEMLLASRALMARGVVPGSRVAIWAPNSVAWVRAFLGVLASGASVVPINTRFKGAEAGYVVGRSGAERLFTVDGFRGNDYVGMLSEWQSPSRPDVVLLGDGAAREGTTSWDDFVAGGAIIGEAEAQARLEGVGADAVAYVLFTSGTTGKPKGALIRHGQSLELTQRLTDHLQLTDRDRVLVVIPLFHIFGLNIGFVLPAATGAGTVIASVFEPAAMMATIERERIGLLPGPPTVFAAILDAPERAARDLSSLRLGLVSAAGPPAALIHRILDEGLVDSAITAYGLTEALVVSCSELGDDPEHVAEYAGRVLDGVEVRVVDRAGDEVAPGEQGELLVRSAMITSGYLDDPQATAAAIDAHGWLRTGDLGVVAADGSLKITGRAKDVFIVGGFNAYPAEIEDMLREHPSIADAAVLGMPDERMGEVGVAFVVLSDGGALEPAEIIEWAKPRMANYKVPRVVEILDALPLTASLKVTKQPLLARVHEIAEGARA